MTFLENQPDRLPTNKALTMFGGTVALAPIVGPAVAEIWPQIAPAFLAGPAATELLAAALAGLLSLALAYFVPDRMGSVR